MTLQQSTTPPLIVYYEKTTHPPLINTETMSVGVTWRNLIDEVSYPLRLMIFEHLHWPYPETGVLPIIHGKIMIEAFNLYAYLDNTDHNIVYISLDKPKIAVKLQFVVEPYLDTATFHVRERVSRIEMYNYV
ncbi:hypothetical protein HT594_00013 [Phenacoccus solenopsis nudivirus]|nr:hypothetical protein HT594_00013 [Phenacoccus solenopsis nudivirus]